MIYLLLIPAVFLYLAIGAVLSGLVMRFGQADDDWENFSIFVCFFWPVAIPVGLFGFILMGMIGWIIERVSGDA